MSNRVFIIGVGMTKFERGDKEARELGQAAAKDALADADISYDKIVSDRRSTSAMAPMV